jgi:hypothetical protein
MYLVAPVVLLPDELLLQLDEFADVKEELSGENPEPSYYDGHSLVLDPEEITVWDQVNVMRKCLNASSGRKQKMSKKQKKVDPAVKSYIHRLEKSNRVLKYFDTLVSAQASVAGGSLTDLCLVPQGLAQQDRIADTIVIEKVDFKCNVTTANTDIFNNVRMSLFWNHQLSSNPVSLAAVYQTPTVSPTFQTEFNYENKQLYKVMHDVQLKLVGTATNPTVDSVMNWRHQVKVNKRLSYGLANTAGSNHLFFIHFADSVAVPNPSVSFRCRIYFRDAG